MSKRNCNNYSEYNYWYGIPLSIKPYDFKNKEKHISNLCKYMFDRTQSMFEYDDLPVSIPRRDLELLLQINGYACIAEVNGELYAFYGGLGGEPDPYYQPTECIVANPALKFNKTLKIHEDCVIIKNDSLYMGLLPLFRRYATLIAENELTMKTASLLSRIPKIMKASTEQTYQNALNFLKAIDDGDLGVIQENNFMEDLDSVAFSDSGAASRQMTDLIEYEQYLKAGWFNEIGILSNYNMKRESINADEAQMNDDALLPLIDDMKKCREEGWEEVKSLFNKNVTVNFGSSWEDMEEQPENDDVEQEDQNGDNFNGDSNNDVDSSDNIDTVEGMTEEKEETEEATEETSEEATEETSEETETEDTNVTEVLEEIADKLEDIAEAIEPEEEESEEETKEESEDEQE